MTQGLPRGLCRARIKIERRASRLDWPAQGWRRILSGCAALAVLMPSSAQAHVKWFAPYDVAANPAPLPDVFSPSFLLLLAGSTVLIMLIGLCDRVIAGAFGDDPLKERVASLKPRLPDVIRIMLGAFLLCLWLKGGIILTPELTTTSESISWFQLFLAMSTASWRTSWIAGLGIVVLYAIAVANYGLFHLLDYPLFLGIAAYLIIHSLRVERLLPYALSILYVSMAVTLLWASIEKWAFASWTLPLLRQHDRITLGIEHGLYMQLAGFVEFVTAFLLLYGKTSQRLAALTLFVIFMAAIVDFGKIDAVGHSMIIASLAVMVIHGNTRVNVALLNRIPSPTVSALELGMTYLGFVLLFFTFYYVAHGIFYGSLN